MGISWTGGVHVRRRGRVRRSGSLQLSARDSAPSHLEPIFVDVGGGRLDVVHTEMCVVYAGQDDAVVVSLDLHVLVQQHADAQPLQIGHHGE
jgi:hypothetical protein